MNLLSNLRNLYNTGRQHGLSGLKARLSFLAFAVRQKSAYQRWIKRFDTLTDEDRDEMRRQLESFSNNPLISIVLPVYNIDEKWLRLCIESVVAQVYENWQLCIADDCSTEPHIRRVLKEYSARDDRIDVVFRPENGHISAASNSALKIVKGEFTVLLDHDDELSEHALFYVVKELNDYPDTQMIYSDEDLIDDRGRRFDPKFKPDWSLDHFYSANIITHLSAYRTDVLREISGFTIGLEGSQDYDLALRVIEKIDEDQIRHIPRILYHWRVIEGSVALDGGEKPYAHDAARRAVSKHFERLGKKVRVEEAVRDLHRVRYILPDKPPVVSLILLADSDPEFTREAVRNYAERTDYQNLEITLVCPEKKFESEALELVFDGGEADRYNAAVGETSGEILCFAELNLSPMSMDWLTELVSLAMQDEIGAVGAKLLDRNETILHGGLLFGINGGVGVAHRGMPVERDGHLVRGRVINNFSAVSVSCLAVRRTLFEKFGGFDAESFPNKYFDADFCLKLRSENFRNVFTPYAELRQVDAGKLLNVQEKGSADELINLRQKWPALFEGDPFHNPNLSKGSENFAIRDS